ncbi:MAG: hypothetical protein WBS19_09830 [Candidatus Korobacteraceae bacterium]
MSGLPPEWSSEELKALLNQALALEYVKLQRKEQESPPPRKSVWPSMLQAIAPTVATVLLGTILGGYLADRIQETNRRNEARRAAQQANLAAEQKTVDDAFTVAGKTVAASQDLIDITGEGFDESAKGLTAEERKVLVAQKSTIWQTYNSAIAAWRVERDRLGMLLAVRYDNPVEVNTAWRSVVDGVDNFSECALKYNKQVHQSIPHSELQFACDKQRGVVRDSLGKLTEILVKERIATEDRGTTRSKDR